MQPFQYLGFILIERQFNIHNQKCFRTHNDLQNLLGYLNWVHQPLGISNSELTHTFQTLEGGPTLNCPRCLNPADQKKLKLFLDILQKSYLSKFIARQKVWLLIISIPKLSTCAIVQLSGPLEWVYLELISALITNARLRTISLLSFDPHT